MNENERRRTKRWTKVGEKRDGHFEDNAQSEGKACLGGRGVVVLYMEGAMLPNQACIGQSSYSCRLRLSTLSFSFPTTDQYQANLFGKLDGRARPRSSTSVKVMPVQQASKQVSACLEWFGRDSRDWHIDEKRSHD